MEKGIEFINDRRIVYLELSFFIYFIVFMAKGLSRFSAILAIQAIHPLVIDPPSFSPREDIKTSLALVDLSLREPAFI
jgi:hypothetical protein